MPAEGLLDGPLWHGHEIVYGYLAAARAGFFDLGDKKANAAPGRAVARSPSPALPAEPAAAARGTASDLAFLPL